MFIQRRFSKTWTILTDHILEALRSMVKLKKNNIYIEWKAEAILDPEKFIVIPLDIERCSSRTAI